eukprot:Nitzschia sp. Nitz4//scaffold104_size75438//50375//51100//NITZ4_005662-RA/size75438-processed-gene-0.48-mRNA-1//-1//CDS//3329532404//3478//frame0
MVSSLETFMQALSLRDGQVEIVGDNANSHNLSCSPRSTATGFADGDDDVLTGVSPRKRRTRLSNRNTEDDHRRILSQDTKVSRWAGSLSLIAGETLSTIEDKPLENEDDSSSFQMGCTQTISEHAVSPGSSPPEVSNRKGGDRKNNHRQRTLLSAMPIACPKRRDSVDEGADPTLMNKTTAVVGNRGGADNDKSQSKSTQGISSPASHDLYTIVDLQPPTTNSKQGSLLLALQTCATQTMS